MRLGWAFINSSLTSSVANGPTNSVQFNSGSQILSGSSNLIFNPATNTLSLIGTISASTYVGTGAPAGANKQIQYNSGSSFAASSNLTFDYNTNTLHLTGTLRADNLIVSSSQIFKSGSTIFGDDISDTHQFTGSILGDIVSGTFARFVVVTGSITGSTAQFTTITGSIVTGSTALFTNLTVTNITSTGNISANNLSASANVQGNSLTIVGPATLSGTVDIYSFVQARGTAIRTTNGSGTIVRTQMDSSGNIYASSSLNVSGTATVSGSIFSTGGIAGRFENFSINFAVPTNSYICSINTSASAVTASLGAANTYYSGQTITFKDTAGYAGVAGKQILILPSGSQTIDGQSGLQIATTSGSATITTDGLTSFYIISTI